MADCADPGLMLNDFMEDLRRRAFEEKLPFKGVFELTPRCNFNCGMCYVHLKPEEIPAVGRERTAEEWIALAQQARDAGMVELTLTGGEPFVRPDFRPIYEAVCGMGLLTQIFTNGFLLDEETVQWLRRFPPYALRITLYGMCDETYEAVCGVKGGFTRVLQSLTLLRRAHIPTYLVATITRENEAELGAMIRFARGNHFPFTYTSSLVPPVRGASADAKAHEVSLGLPPQEEIERLRAENMRYPKKPLTDFLLACRNYRRAFWITWSGQMQLCAFLTEPAVPVRAEPGGFLESWHSLLARLETLRQPEACASCRYERYCDRCPGVLYAECGASDRTCDSFCRKARRTFAIYGP